MSSHIATLIIAFAAALVAGIGYALAGLVGFGVGFAAFAVLYLAGAVVLRR